MKAEDNDYLTQVVAGTPMGDYLRSYWVPVMRAARIEAGGAPIRARLFGRNYVAFRATDGRVGLVNEACPHRGASLALGRVEGCALRCLYHGWEIDVSGSFVHARSEDNGRTPGVDMRLTPYPVREAGNMVWAYLGEGEAPPFAEFEWTKPAANARPSGAIVHCNWVQALEGAFDPLHVGYLHSSWIPEFAVQMMQMSKIEYDIEDTEYGFAGVSIRTMDGMPGLARVKEFMLPYYSYVPFEVLEERTVLITVPIDRETCYLWYVQYDATEPKPADLPERTLGIVDLNGRPEDVPMFQYGVDSRLTHLPNPDNFRETVPFDPERLWNQDRAALQAHHSESGIPGLTTEDIVVLESQGAIQDRTTERLARGDIMIAHMRRMLMDRAAAYANGQSHARVTGIDHAAIRSRTGFLVEGMTWRDLPRFAHDLLPPEPDRHAEAAD